VAASKRAREARKRGAGYHPYGKDDKGCGKGVATRSVSEEKRAKLARNLAAQGTGESNAAAAADPSGVPQPKTPEGSP
jgi:hypothetical protein